MKVMFVSPIVSRRYADDWEGVERGLAATVRSLSRQTDPDWKIMVIGGDEPRLPCELADRMEFVEADLMIDDPTRKGRREIDKQRKQYCGYVELRRHMPEFVMPLDYDDLVSTRLVEYVRAHDQFDGFMLKSGYVYRDGEQRCQYSSRVHLRTGSNFVVRYREDLFPAEASDFDPPPEGYLDWPFIESHIKFPDRLFESLGMNYTIVPFPCVVWRRNAHAISEAYRAGDGGEGGLKNRLVGMGKRLFLTRRLGRKLCEEFGCDVGSGMGIKDVGV